MGCLGCSQMLNGVYQNAAAMTGLENWNNAIAQNIAQSSTPGYKKAHLSFEGVEAGSIGIQTSFGKTLHHASIQTKSAGSVDFTGGNIVNSDNEFDFAIEGEGFFELRAPDGQLLYTRDGQFKLNEEGELISKQGFHVMSDARNIITFNGGGPLKGAADGTIRKGATTDKLGVRTIDNPEQLIRTRGGFVAAEGAGRARLMDEPVVRHGALEQSNVSATTEMINLINISRSFQINQRVIQQHDDALGKAIQSLGGH